MELDALALCLASALAYAAAAVVQERTARRPVAGLLRMPSWWMAVGLSGAGAVLHVVALRYGPLSLVQPLGVLTLVLAVPLGALTARRRDNTRGAEDSRGPGGGRGPRRTVGRVEWHGVGLTVSGLGGILMLAGAAGNVGVLAPGDLVGLLLATAAVLTILGGWRASELWAAAAGGVAFGVSSALTQTVAVHVSEDGLGALGRPSVALAAVAIVVLACAGLLFTQRSYRAGLAAPLAVSTVANPVAAAAIGLVLLGERIAGGRVGVAVVAMSALAAALGVGLLAQPRSARDRANGPAGAGRQAYAG